MPRLAIATMLSLALTAPAFAQQRHHGHGAAPTTQRQAHELSSTLEFRAANERMHRDMAIAYSGDADRDFAAGMIPHHQGAIDMARIQLRYGRDPEMRSLAEQVIAAQEAEIARLRAFLARSAPPTR